MLILVAAPAGHSSPNLPACAGYTVQPSAAEHVHDAGLVGRAAGRATEPSSIGTVLTEREWRIVWAIPRNSEPGVFFFHKTGSAFGFVNAWGGPTSSQAQAVRWATRTVGAPGAMAQCFAGVLVEKGP